VPAGQAVGPVLAGPVLAGPVLAARVLPDVAGLDRELDYEVSAEQAGHLQVGAIVRVPLQGRKVRGWVVGWPVDPGPLLQLRPVERVVGFGPEPALVDLAGWAAHLWAGRRRQLLCTASPARAVRALPVPMFAAVPSPDSWWSELVSGAHGPGPHLIQVAPAQALTDLVLAVSLTGPTLVLAPTTARAVAGAAALRRRGASVAQLPEDWEQARAGASIVIGARGAAWGPCPGLANVVVLDAHDEAYAQHQMPTWWAPSVAAQRAERAGARCFWVSPCPTLDMRRRAGGDVIDAGSRFAWPTLRVVDLRDQDPRTGLLSEPLVSAIRSAPGRAVCVLNRKGRAQLLACASCSEVARCEVCRSGLAMQGPGTATGEVLVCRRCGRCRPVVCALCGSDVMRALRPGVSRVRDHLEALLGLPVAEVVAGSAPVPGAKVVVGTEAVLHRLGELRRGGEVSLVAFLDFDQELLATRYRAAEEALSLLALAARLVGTRRPGVAVLAQTRVPGHAVLRAAGTSRPGVALEGEEEVRRALCLPPFSALAVVSGDAGPELAERLRACAGEGVDISEMDDRRWLVRAPDEESLAELLAQAGRPDGRTRVEVGPVRL
jgi:primosomal protein N' (replication factor Y)